jgi:ribosomal protein S18 acetylase RimI-like enzyme
MLDIREKDLSFYKTVEAYVDGKIVGHIDFDYNKYNDEILIIMIKVDEAYRRQGIATNMLKYIENKYKCPISWTGKTKDGESLYKSYYT